MNDQVSLEIGPYFIFGIFMVLIAVLGPVMVMNIIARLMLKKIKQRLLLAAKKDLETGIKEVKSILFDRIAPEFKWFIVCLAGFMGIILLLPGVILMKAVAVALMVIVALAMTKEGWEYFVYTSCKEALGSVLTWALRKNAGAARVLMQAAWETGEKGFCLQAIEGAQYLQSPWTIEFMAGPVRKSDYNENRLEIKAGKKKRGIRKAKFTGPEVDSLENLKRLVNQNYFWRWFALFSQRKIGRQLLDKERGRFNKELENAFLHQADLCASFPRVYCLKDNTFGEMKKEAGWQYVTAPVSGDFRDMKAGVRMVIGTIGPNQKVEFEQGILRIPLWDERLSKAKPVPLNVIDIQAGGAFNYDWAVSAVLEAMRNRFPTSNLKYKVHIDTSIGLSDNTRALLENAKTR